MHIKTFYADTLEQAMAAVRSEMGSEAVILNTRSNRWPLSLLGRKRFEVTAVLTRQATEQRVIDESLDTLDEFLAESPNSHVQATDIPVEAGSATMASTEISMVSSYTAAMGQIRKIEQLEKKIVDLANKLESGDYGLTSLHEVAILLKSSGVGEDCIHDIISKLARTSSPVELADRDVLFEKTYRLMETSVTTAIPLFSLVDRRKGGVVTALISEAASGQTSIAYKLAGLKGDACVIRYGTRGAGPESGREFYSRMLGIETVEAPDTATIVSEASWRLQTGRNIFVDFRSANKDMDEVASFCSKTMKAFKLSETLLCLSAIHSEIYNEKQIIRYSPLIGGMIFSHMDLCLNPGAVFNLASRYKETPVKLFGTGKTVPDDIETATAERILHTLFGIRKGVEKSATRKVTSMIKEQTN
jgi:flagellar biosynthesis GTPase FlhF